MNTITFTLNGLSCLCVLFILWRFYKIKKKLYTNAWTRINTAFIIVLIKWIYDGWLLYKVEYLDGYSLVHEILTFGFAVFAASGFHTFSKDFIKAIDWGRRYKGRQSGDTLSKTLVQDLDEHNNKGELNND